MISNQVLQNTLEGLKEISRTEFCVLDTEGKVLASTFADFSIATQDVQAFVESQADSQLVKGFQYFKVCEMCIRDRPGAVQSIHSLPAAAITVLSFQVGVNKGAHISSQALGW